MLSVKNLSVKYGSLEIIRALSFQLNQPEFVVICGHNGCGKSSLLKAINDNIEYSGIVSASSKNVGYLPQFNNVSFPIDVEQLLLMGKFRSKHFLDSYTTKDIADVLDLLESLGMKRFITSDFLKLSGGEQQLIWIAQIVLQQMPIYLFDEPTQHLDIKNKKIVFNLLRSLVSKDNKLVLCVTHDLTSLKGSKGYLLNMSKPSPELEVMNDSSLEENIYFLENN